MYKIVDKEILAPGMFSMDILAPRVAASALPGQFVIVITDAKGERIPLTVCDLDRGKGTVNIVVQEVGYSTKKMARLAKGDFFADFVGPLGRPSDFVNEELADLKQQKILFVAGGVGIAPIYPQVQWFHERNIGVDVIMGAKTKDLIILAEKIKKVAQNLYICTDDGSYGFKGLVTDKMRDLLEKQGKHYDRVIAIGPMIMMKYVSKLTEKANIPTTVSLNTIMVDGTGMCGACRVTVGGETKFACVDGPEFDGHLVDFDEALRRQGQYLAEERNSDLKFEKMSLCKCTKGGAGQDG